MSNQSPIGRIFTYDLIAAFVADIARVYQWAPTFTGKNRPFTEKKTPIT